MTPAQKSTWVSTASFVGILFSLYVAYFWYTPRAEVRAHARGMIELSRMCHTVANHQVNDSAKLAQLKLCLVLGEHTIEWWEEHK